MSGNITITPPPVVTLNVQNTENIVTWEVGEEVNINLQFSSQQGPSGPEGPQGPAWPSEGVQQAAEQAAQQATAKASEAATSAAAAAADRVQTGLDAAQALASKHNAAASQSLAQAWASQPEDVPIIEDGVEFSSLHWAAKSQISQGIAGSFAASAVDAAAAAAQARDDAVAVVTGGTASLTPAAGKLPIAGANGKIDQEWFDPLPGVTAAALHRSPNAVTALFVYDTSKDSDGGAWTEKCQHTSWYNEPINGKWLGAQASEAAARAVSGATTGDYFQRTTDGKFYRLNAGSGTTEVFRGNKRDFPRLAGIVAETANVTIYDLTEPGRPMWMRMQKVPGQGIGLLGIHSNNERVISCLGALNGNLCVGSNMPGYTPAMGSPDYGLTVINFISDTGKKFIGGSLGAYLGDISRRNLQLGFIYSPSYFLHSYVNSIAMTVLPGAPIDPVTGLQSPTIAVATAGGLSVIDHNGKVFNNTNTIQGSALVTIVKTFRNLGFLAAGQGDRVRLGLVLHGNYTQYALTYKDASIATGESGPHFPPYFALRAIEGEYFGSHTHGVVKTRMSPSNRAKVTMAQVTNTFNTGHQPGDIRRTYLSDIDAGSVGPSTELVTNGTFDADISGWTDASIGSGSISWDASQRLKLVGNVYNANVGRASQTISGLVIGKRYRFSFSCQTGCYIVLSGAVSIAANYSGSNTALNFIAAATTLTIQVESMGGSDPAYVNYVDNISVREAIFDRSYKASSASITGTLTKSLVASAAQLVAYSGFSNSNYLREPYSADLDFGTGEWSVGAWVNVPVSLPTANFPRGSEQAGAFTGPYSMSSGNLTVMLGKTFEAGSSVEISVTLTYGGVNSVKPTLRNASTYGFSPGASHTASFTVVATNLTVAVDRFELQNIGAATGTTITAVSVKEVSPATIAHRAFSSGPSLRMGVNIGGLLTATAYDGTTTRTVTTTAAYNTATWAKAEACYTTDGTLSISVNGVEVAATRGNPLLTLNNSNAVLTIGNSFNLDAPFPGSIALLKLSATVPTAEQSVWMYEQEKQMFREGAQVCLPDAGAIADLAYDEATDKWIAVSAANESEWSGLVRTSVTPVPAGSYSRVTAGGGVQMLARTTTNPGVDITIPAYGLREELVRRAEAAARLNAQLATFDYVGGFTANTTTGNTAITSVAGLTYPTSYIGARVSGAGIPANTTIVAVSGTTIYLSAAATATATGVQISFIDFILPVGYEAKFVLSGGLSRVEGSTKDFIRQFDGFKEAIRFAIAPGYQAAVQIQAVRSQT